MLNEDFVKELFELCCKHKINMSAKIDNRDNGIQYYEADINGAWEIRNDHDAVKVYAVSHDKEVMTIKGTKEV